ncbi:MAG: TOBE domain-containing protein [Cyclobacteriaceae bacterium]
MNIVKGEISDLTVNENLTLVQVKAGDILLNAIVIDTPASASYLKVGQKVNALFKETEVIIGTDQDLRISLQNRIPGIIENINDGQLLSKVTVKTSLGSVKSIITANAVKELELLPGKKVMALIKTNEIMLSTDD